MATFQGPVVCPTISAKQVGIYALQVNEPVRKVNVLRSQFWGCNGILGWNVSEISASHKLNAKRPFTVCCIFSSSSNGNGRKAESFNDNDEDYVNSSVVEAVELKSGSDGFTIKMVDGRLLKCVHNNPRVQRLPKFASHSAIVLKMEDGTGVLLPIVVSETPSIMLMAAICNVKIDRPTMYQVIGEMVDKMGYVVQRVRVTQRVNEAYFARIYLSKIGDESECVSFDLRPSDAINIAVRCQVPIQVNKYLASSDGVRIIEAPRSSTSGAGADGLLLTDMDRPSEWTGAVTYEFTLMCNMIEAANQERYEDAIKWRNELTALRATSSRV